MRSYSNRSTKIGVFLATALLGTTGCGSSDDTNTSERVGSNQAEVKVCASGTPIEGIDVSHWNDVIDWPTVKASGIEFSIAKATESLTYVDATFDTNRSGAKAAGIAFGAYHFFRANDDPVAQAQHFADTLGAVPAGEISPVLDLETTDGQSAATIASNAAAFLQKVESLTGRAPIIYTSPSFYTSTLGSPPELAAYPLWIANWDTTCPTVPSEWTDWSVWQYSDSGVVGGISTGVDLDRFDGTVDELLCVGVTCPSGACVAGACSGAAGSGGGAGIGGASGAGGTGGTTGGTTGSGAQSGTGGLGGKATGGVGGTSTGGQHAKPVSSDDDGGCGCRAPASRTKDNLFVLLALVAGWVAIRRRVTWPESRPRRSE